MEGPGLARTEFSAFPYPPYAIQQQFMQQLYCTVEQGNVGLFESPTGTGKTLSVICSVLQWLLDTQELLKQQELERAKQQQEQQQQEQQQQASQGEGMHC
jgi:chromosome transmission fidelity protein 1